MPATPTARLHQALIRHSPGGATIEPKLHAALAHLALHPGKLLRAQLTLAGAEHHGMPPDAAESVACAVEFFHTASLVLDDLPCMDDAMMRRGHLCVHRQQGEATAILAALALINRAYSLIGHAFAAQPLSARLEATSCLEKSLGIAGIVGGQAWDLSFAQTDRSARTVSRIAAAKTGALFSLTLLLPATIARRSKSERRWLHALAVYWGQQFQATDDLRDVLTSSAESGKTGQRDQKMMRPNLAIALGLPATRARLARLGRQSSRALDRLLACGGDRWNYLRHFHDALIEIQATSTEDEIVAA